MISGVKYGDTVCKGGSQTKVYLWCENTTGFPDPV